jgi:hypothetical protein
MEYPEVSIAFNLLNMQDIYREHNMETMESSHHELNQEMKFDIVIYFREYQNGFEINWNYRSTLFQPETIEFMANKYLELMEELTQE